MATSEGVFYLSEVKSYDEKQILVRKVQPSAPQSVTPETDPEQEQRNTRKNIFTRIFGRRTDQPKVVPSQVPAPKPKPVVKYTRKTISKLKSINHLYRKVEGLNEKCRQLVSTPYGILAATNKGLFNINDHKAELITPDRYINFINWTPYGEQYYIAAVMVIFRSDI